MPLKAKHHAVFALILANIIWGATSPIVKWSLEGIGPFSLAFFRFFAATVILLPFAVGFFRVNKKDIGRLILMTLFGVTINIGLFFLALEYTDSINAPLIGSSAPLFTAFACVLFLGQKPKIKTLVGGFIGFLGVLIIILQPVLEKGVDGSLTGNILLVASTFSSIIQLFIAKSITKKYNAITLTFYSFFLGTLSFVPLFLYEISTIGMPEFSTKSMGGIIYCAVFASAVAHYLYYGAIKYFNADEVSLFSYITPVVAIMVAIPLLNEQLTTVYLLGAMLVFLGIYAAEADIHYHPFHHRS